MDEWRMHPVLSVTIFFLFGFVARLLLNYLREGILLFSIINAGVWTLASTLVFIPFYRGLGSWKGIASACIIYAALFLAMYLYLLVPPNFTLKIAGSYLFRDGFVTNFGIASYLLLLLVDILIALIGLVIAFKGRPLRAY